jgi:solute carrier family 45 protein 1/2/4
MWLLMMSYGTPYLISLGLSDSLTALVWLAGPLSGAIAQPIFGALSDQCRHSWGRRKPFILGGAVCVVFCLMLMACAPDLVNFFAQLAGRKSGGGWVQTIIQAWSILSVYGLNVAMQPLQSATRAFIIDTCPAHQQAQASAWCSRFSGLGSVSIYLLGFAAILNRATRLAGTEFKALSIIGALALITTVITCCLVREKPLSPGEEYQDIVVTAGSIMKSLWHSLRTLPPTTWKVCKIQFFAWLAWFPVLYYTTT